MRVRVPKFLVRSTAAVWCAKCELSLAAGGALGPLKASPAPQATGMTLPDQLAAYRDHLAALNQCCAHERRTITAAEFTETRRMRDCINEAFERAEPGESSCGAALCSRIFGAHLPG